MMDTPEFQRGRAAEIFVAEWLKNRGWFVVPSYDYSGSDGDKAPRLHGADNVGFAVPDLDISKGGKRRWVEVKTKACASFTRKTQRFEHGISARLWRHYREVQEITGTEVWLFVIEEDTRTLLVQSLDKLGEPRLYEGGKMGFGGMAFWPREKFRLTELKAAADEPSLVARVLTKATRQHI